MIKIIPVKYFGIKYLKPSAEIHEPKKIFNAKKCNQKTNKKLSVANIVYKPSKLEYKFKISKNCSSKRIALYIT